MFLPFFRALKVYVEVLGRGLPAYVKKDVLLPALDPLDPIHRQGIFSWGVSFQPHARVDFGVSVQAGVGGLAPWSISCRFLTWSLGKTYEGRSGTPLGQMVVDATREFVSWAVEKAKSIDPYIRNSCVLYDDNHQPMGKLGELAPDGQACIYQGLRIPINKHFWRNHGETQVCYDEKRTDCFLIRTDKYSPWEPVHPMLIGTDCFAYYNGRPWMRTGTPTPDKQGCERDGHVIPMGQTMKPNHNHPGYHCYDEPDKIKHQTEKLWCLEAPPQPQTDGEYLGRRFAGGIDRSQDSLEKDSQKFHQAIDEGAAGVPLHATTPVKEAEAQGREALDKVKNATVDDAENVFYGSLSAAKKWWEKPARQKMGDVAEDAGDTMASPSTWAAGAGAVFGRGGKALSVGADVLADAEKLGKEGKQLGKVAKKAGAAVAIEDEAVHTAPAWNGAHQYHPAPKTLDAFPAAKKAPRRTPVQGGGNLRKRWKDPDGIIYEWDGRHGTVEIYTKQGQHIGEFDPRTGAQLKPRDPARSVKK
jgi:hypothetical protein